MHRSNFGALTPRNAKRGTFTSARVEATSGSLDLGSSSAYERASFLGTPRISNLWTLCRIGCPYQRRMAMPQFVIEREMPGAGKLNKDDLKGA